MLASGLVIGLLSAAVGVIGGILLSFALRPPLHYFVGLNFPGLHLRWLEIFGIAAIGVITSVLAALIPALTAGRTRAVALLGRTPPTNRSAGIWSILGAVLCAAGIGITLAAATSPLPENPQDILAGRSLALGAGVLLAQLGLMMSTPLILLAMAKIGSWLPTTPRLALRDAARHRSRTAPAVAAIMAASAGAVAVAMFMSSVQAEQVSNYEPSLGSTTCGRCRPSSTRRRWPRW